MQILPRTPNIFDRYGSTRSLKSVYTFANSLFSLADSPLPPFNCRSCIAKCADIPSSVTRTSMPDDMCACYMKRAPLTMEQILARKREKQLRKESTYWADSTNHGACFQKSRLRMCLIVNDATLRRILGCALDVMIVKNAVYIFAGKHASGTRKTAALTVEGSEPKGSPTQTDRLSALITYKTQIRCSILNEENKFSESPLARPLPTYPVHSCLLFVNGCLACTAYSAAGNETGGYMSNDGRQVLRFDNENETGAPHFEFILNLPSLLSYCRHPHLCLGLILILCTVTHSQAGLDRN